MNENVPLSKTENRMVKTIIANTDAKSKVAVMRKGLYDLYETVKNKTATEKAPAEAEAAQ
jgi:hypothetical protein